MHVEAHVIEQEEKEETMEGLEGMNLGNTPEKHHDGDLEMAE